MLEISIDANLENADWTKQSWDLPEYKSPAFMQIIGGEEGLEKFRNLPIYRHAVRKGLIVDDGWVGNPKRER